MIWEKIFNGGFEITDNWNSIWWFLLNSKNFKIVNFYDITKNEINIYKKIKKDGFNFLDYNNLNKNIEIWIIVKWKNPNDLREKLNNLRKILFSWVQTLKIKYLWEYRFLDVICENNDLNFEHYNNYFLKINLKFVSLLPYWSSWILQRESFLENQNIFTKNILNEGTAESEMKIFIYPILNNWCSKVSLKINKKELFFEIDWTLKIEIDTKNFTVKIWDKEVEWNWEFENLRIWENEIIFKRKNWELSFNLDILYEKNYV